MSADKKNSQNTSIRLGSYLKGRLLCKKLMNKKGETCMIRDSELVDLVHIDQY